VPIIDRAKNVFQHYWPVFLKNTPQFGRKYREISKSIGIMGSIGVMACTNPGGEKIQLLISG
jgi:hypothetical protein